ncbi:MAG: tryptophanase [Deltaproteobacteria bacterium]|nr:tryptophanase [Deltaproteobacteria bacterium]
MNSTCPPFRIKVVEPIPVTTREIREAALQQAGYNLFRVPAQKVGIDLLTDSGTGAMSAAQWAHAFEADEAYAGAQSFQRFERTVRAITGMEQVLPVHQGRAGERIVFEVVVREGDLVPSNHAFDTTRANLERRGARVIDIPHPSSRDPLAPAPFKGDIDLERLEEILRTSTSRIPLVLITVTDNTGGGQPVQPSNVVAAARLCKQHGIPMWIDAARFAENAGLVLERDPESRGRSPREIARQIFDLADGALMSCKKDGMANIGGFVALRSRELYERLAEVTIATEGFVTYGGLAGRDLDAIATGLEEALDPGYLTHRLGQVRHLHASLTALGIPCVTPPGGHAVFVDAGALLPHIPADRFPGHSLALELYREAGIRSCEIGTLMFCGGKDPKPPDSELLRLALPRRVYETAHLDYVAAALGRIRGRARELPGYRILEGHGPLRHFTARLEPVPA